VNKYVDIGFLTWNGAESLETLIQEKKYKCGGDCGTEMSGLKKGKKLKPIWISHHRSLFGTWHLFLCPKETTE
jgi:hypothetical protein